MNRKAQAAGLIGIITLLIIFYILFLPPEARRELLAKEERAPPRVVPGVPARAFLLQATPGRLSALGVDEFTHSIPNLVLREEREAQVLAEFNPFTIRKGWLRKQFRNLSFALTDPKNTKNVQLSFQTPVNKGKLRIWFNGQLVFEGDIDVNNPPPVRLPDALLKPINNFEFQVWGLGLTAREYAFRDVKLVGDITAVERQRATNTFTITEPELQNFESGYLGFFAICDQQNIGILDVSLNDRIIFSAVPACGSPNRQDLFAEDLKPGKNTLVFTLRKGTARLEQIVIKSFVKPTKAWSDFFFIEPQVWSAIATGQARVILDIEFVDDGRLKEAQTSVNGRLDVISQRDPRYVRDISGVARQGNNYIELIPLTDLSIARVDVRLE